jgi:hypothetical protein
MWKWVRVGPFCGGRTERLWDDGDCEEQREEGGEPTTGDKPEAPFRHRRWRGREIGASSTSSGGFGSAISDWLVALEEAISNKQFQL